MLNKFNTVTLFFQDEAAPSSSCSFLAAASQCLGPHSPNVDPYPRQKLTLGIAPSPPPPTRHGCLPPGLQGSTRRAERRHSIPEGSGSSSNSFSFVTPCSTVAAQRATGRLSAADIANSLRYKLYDSTSSAFHNVVPALEGLHLSGHGSGGSASGTLSNAGVGSPSPCPNQAKSKENIQPNRYTVSVQLKKHKKV